ncbi:MAG: hypothetical protein NTW35_02930 [Candidatus Nomurabacteria bacterium]|nr:hypothetical protein [Candidatus Nomurabacteria bacterium]
MKHIANGVSLVFSRKDSRIVLIVSTAIFFLLLLLAQNGKTAFSVFSFDTISFAKQLTLATSTLFDISNTFSVNSLILSTLGSLLGGINISLAYIYMKTRGEVIIKSGLYSGIGLFLAFIGVGCAACGTALIAVLLSFLGLSTMIRLLPYQGQEIGYIGIIFLCMATYSLAVKVTAPTTC